VVWPSGGAGGVTCVADGCRAEDGGDTGGAMMMAADPDEAALRARLAAAGEAVRRAVAEAGLDPGLAAAACAELAGENAAVLAATRGLPPGPLLDEAAGVLRRRGAAVHDALGAEGARAAGGGARK
jgi:hypothetical protein